MSYFGLVTQIISALSHIKNVKKNACFYKTKFVFLHWSGWYLTLNTLLFMYWSFYACRPHLWKGINKWCTERSCSYVFNMNHILFTVQDISVHYIKTPEVLARFFFILVVSSSDTFMCKTKPVPFILTNMDVKFIYKALVQNITKQKQ